jgi:hypothetical protein
VRFVSLNMKQFTGVKLESRRTQKNEMSVPFSRSRSPSTVPWKKCFFHVCWRFGQEEESIRREREAILEKKMVGNNYDSMSNGKLDKIRKWNSSIALIWEKLRVCRRVH